MKPRYDDRKGLGYGQLDLKYHAPRQAGSVFPYSEPDPYADEEYEDEVTEKSIDTKNPGGLRGSWWLFL